MRLNTEIKRAAKRDREQWLIDLAGSADWSKLHLLKRGTLRTGNQGRLIDNYGILVDSGQRADLVA